MPLIQSTISTDPSASSRGASSPGLSPMTPVSKGKTHFCLFVIERLLIKMFTLCHIRMLFV